MTTRTLALGALLVGLAAQSAAAVMCGDTAACLGLIESRQADTHALAARFEQTKYISLMTQPLHTRGQFAFKRPDTVVWQVDEPRTTVRIDRAGLQVLNAAVSKADVDAIAPVGGLFRGIGGLFSGSLAEVQKDFSVEARADGDLLRVRLVPRRPEWKRVATVIDLAFTPPDYTIGTFRLEDPLGDRLEVRFFDVRRNDAVPAHLFDLTDSPP
ncbi:outer membrane lipoprotein carrier protein LolA [Candidatus Binatia bacterium]|nr:outer membrane lipoprotein carrier protein LolA [Candidatus Binatia bacterium]